MSGSPSQWHQSLSFIRHYARPPLASPLNPYFPSAYSSASISHRLCIKHRTHCSISRAAAESATTAGKMQMADLQQLSLMLSQEIPPVVQIPTHPQMFLPFQEHQRIHAELLQLHQKQQQQQQLVLPWPPTEWTSMAAGSPPAADSASLSADAIEIAPLPAAEDACGEAAANGNSSARWPRHETAMLLKIRSEMDCRFRHSSNKAQLWEEVSRAMADEGYRRGAKKCKEKFENLCKYYRKTKEGKAVRRDGKHYRFFGQLETLYGGAAAAPNTITTTTTTTTFNDNNHSESSGKLVEEKRDVVVSPSLSSCSSSSSDDDGSQQEKQTQETMGKSSGGGRKRKRTGGSSSAKACKCLLKAHIETLVREFMDRQEAWLNKVLETLEEREQQRIAKEEAWRRHEAARLYRQQQLQTLESQRLAAIIASLEKFNADHNFEINNKSPAAMADQKHESATAAATSSIIPEFEALYADALASCTNSTSASISAKNADDVTLELEPPATEAKLFGGCSCNGCTNRGSNNCCSISRSSSSNNYLHSFLVHSDT